MHLDVISSVADHDFPDGGRNFRVWAENLLFGKIFAKNCIPDAKAYICALGTAEICKSLVSHRTREDQTKAQTSEEPCETSRYTLAAFCT